VDISNFPDCSYEFDLRNRTLKELMGYALSSWYIPDELGILLRISLEEKSKQYSYEDRTILQLFLQSKAETIIFLIETNLWHTRDFFGNFLKDIEKSIIKLRFSNINRKVKAIQRKRGYHDHGSLKPKDRWLPTFDYTLTQLQNEIELKRSSQEFSLQFIRGMLQ